MMYLERVQRGIDFIEAQLAVDLEITDVARHAGLSHWHFQRIFKALTNDTLKTYIRSRRLAMALEMLLSTEQRVIEIALAAGFHSQASFTRAFKLAYAVTPAACRQTGRHHQFLHKPRFEADHLRPLPEGSLEPELCEQAGLWLVGMPTRFFGVDSHKNNIAQKLPPLWAAFLQRLSEVPDTVAGCCYGIVCPRHDDTDELEYLAAIAVRHDRVAVPPGMVLRRLPGGRYAKFAHIGRAAGVDQTVNHIYGQWLPRSGMRHRAAADIEFYGPGYHPTSDSSVLHYAIPVEDA